MTRAFVLAAALAAPVHLTVAPWAAPPLPAASQSAAKLALTIAGRPGAKLRLRATGVAHGWLAAFCTGRVCSPESVDVTLPPSGRTIYEFELIRQTSDAPARSGAHIVGDDGSALDVPPLPAH